MKDAHKHDYSKWFLNITLSLVLLCMLVFAYLLFLPREIITIKKVTVLTPVVRDGGTLTYNFDYCKHRNQDGVVYRELRSVSSNDVINLPIVSTVSIPGCHVAKVHLTLPKDVPAGTYTVHGDNVYRVNGLRTITTPFNSNKFEVVR